MCVTVLMGGFIKQVMLMKYEMLLEVSEETQKSGNCNSLQI